MDKDIAKDIKQLNSRIAELEKMLATLMQPLQQLQTTTQRYLRLIQLLLEHGGLTPELILPGMKDPISQEIVRVLLDKPDQNLSQITERVRNRRGTASRRIIRERVQQLIGKKIIGKKQDGSRYVYHLTDDVIKKWSQLLGFTI